MASILRRHISFKISDILNKLSIVKDDTINIGNKIDFYTKINRVDRNSKEFGIYTFNLASLKADLKVNLKQLSQSQLNEIQNLKDDSIESCHLDRNFKLSIKVNIEKLKQDTLHSIYQQTSSYGYHLQDDELYPKGSKNKEELLWYPKKSNANTIIEFSSPNIAKPLHAGHMRSTFLGNFLSNLHENLGQNVTKITYLGDWGTQYGILAVGFNKYGSYEQLEVSPIKHLLDVYVKANQDTTIKADALQYFSEMEANNEQNLKLWSLFKNLSIKELESVYKKLGIEFDVYEFESQYYLAAKDFVKKLIEYGLAHKLDDNAVNVSINLENLGKKKTETLNYIVQKANGSTLYITRDIAALFERKKKYNYSKIVYVVDNSQKDHFVKLFYTAKAMDENILKNISFDEFYVPFGRLTNMSTRRGKVEFLNDLIEEAKLVALESMEFSKTKKDLEDRDYVAQNIGNSHLIITDLLRPRIKDYEFSWSNIVSKDDSAFMCHYAHARLTSLINKCKNEMRIDPSLDQIDYTKLNKGSELAVIQHLSRFEDAVWQSFQEYEPYHIVQYLFQLVRLTNICLKENYVMDEEESTARARLLLYNSCKQVISNSFRVVGVTPLDRI